MGVFHSHGVKTGTAGRGTTHRGAAWLHGKVRLGSGHLGLIGVAVHGDKVSGHAVEVPVVTLNTPAALTLYNLGGFHKRAGHADIFGRLTGTIQRAGELTPRCISHERHEVTGRPIGIALGVGACNLVKRAWVGQYRVGGANALCASLAPCRGVAGKLYRRGVKGRLWPREALISRCLAPRYGLPVQQSRWIRPAAGTPPVATSGVARAVRGFYLSHEVTALAKGYKVVEGERPAVRWRQVHVDSATAQPAHSQSRVALKFAPPTGDLFAP